MAQIEEDVAEEEEQIEVEALEQEAEDVAPLVPAGEVVAVLEEAEVQVVLNQLREELLEELVEEDVGVIIIDLEIWIDQNLALLIMAIDVIIITTEEIEDK